MRVTNPRPPWYASSKETIFNLLDGVEPILANVRVQKFTWKKLVVLEFARTFYDQGMDDISPDLSDLEYFSYFRSNFLNVSNEQYPILNRNNILSKDFISNSYYITRLYNRLEADEIIKQGGFSAD